MGHSGHSYSGKDSQDVAFSIIDITGIETQIHRFTGVDSNHAFHQFEMTEERKKIFMFI